MTTAEKRKAARKEIIRKLKYESEHPQEGCTELINWPNSNGADYTIISFFNEKDDPCTKEQSIYKVIDEYTNDDKLISHKTEFGTNSIASNARFNRDHPMRKFQVQQTKWYMAFKCGTPLMNTCFRIHKEGKEKGWSDVYMKQLTDEACEMQNFRFFRADKIDLREIEILQTTDNITQKEASKQAEFEIDAYDNMQKMADEFFNKEKPELNADERLARWNLLMNKFKEGK